MAIYNKKNDYYAIVGKYGTGAQKVPTKSENTVNYRITDESR